jgi:hypothetical protein
MLFLIRESSYVADILAEKADIVSAKLGVSG